MIYLKKGQKLVDNPGMVVYDSSGYYNDGDSIICASNIFPDEPVCRYEAKYIAYGGMVYSISDPDELLEQVKKIDPKSLFGKDSQQVAVDKAVSEIVPQETITAQQDTVVQNDNATTTPESNIPEPENNNATSTDPVLPNNNNTSTTTEPVLPNNNTSTTTPEFTLPNSESTTTPEFTLPNNESTTAPEFILPNNESTTTPDFSIPNNESTTTPELITEILTPSPVPTPEITVPIQEIPAEASTTPILLAE